MAEAAPPSNILCKYFMSGVCREGSECRFSHDRVNSKPENICRYYMKGTCAYGRNCRYDHIKPNNDKKSKWNKKPKPVFVNKSVSDKNRTNLTSSWADAPEFIPQQFRVEKSYAGAVGFQDIDDTAKVVPAEQELCPYAEAGNCPYVDCERLHGDICEYCEKECLHPYNEEQRKKHHAECLREHEDDMVHSFRVAVSMGKQCGICMDTVLEKEPPSARRFGVLPNCNHIFCIECIRKWRQAKQFENKIIRACPECRVTSDYVCPSKYWVEDEADKKELLDSYKVALGNKDCKHFKQGKSDCPFGNKCFYRHANAEGNKVDVGPPRRRRLQNANCDSEILNRLLLWEFIEDRENRFLALIDGDDFLQELFSFESDAESDFSETELELIRHNLY